MSQIPMSWGSLGRFFGGVSLILLLVACSSSSAENSGEPSDSVGCETSPFAGSYFDKAGQQVILLTDTSIDIRDHPLWSTAQIRRVEFPLCQLSLWLDSIYTSSVAGGLNYADINEVENRLDLGFADAAWSARAKSVADSLGIPESARFIFQSDPMVLE